MYSKLINWCKLIALTGTVQLTIQISGLISGIFILRMLPVQEYALYTIANTMLGTMIVLTDSGISSGVMAKGGAVWQDRSRLGIILATGLEMRKRFAKWSLTLSTPVLVLLLMHHNANLVTSCVIAICLIPAFFASLSDSILEIGPKLHQDVRSLQKNQLYVSIVRLMLSTLTLFFFPFTAIALLANGIPRVIGNIKLLSLTEKFADTNLSSDKEVSKDIGKMVSRVMPTAIYYCVSGQITVWLLSLFGSTPTLASFGALGRVTALFSVISVVFATIIVPRFARLPPSMFEIRKQFLINQISLFGICLCMITLIHASSPLILKILGKSYLNLKSELVLVSISSCVSLISQSTNSLLSARGIIMPATLFITTALTIQIIGVFLFDISGITGITLYSISTTTCIYVIRLIYFYNITKILNEAH
jgi:O-antigen/teichoic acid export membrane protein